ncbi:MAG: DUF6382 domain-containing protein [Eubacteriales bacterium]
MENKISKEGRNINGKIRNELNYKELSIFSEQAYSEDYQLAMLKENILDGILKVTGCGTNNGSQYLYDISGMISMKKLYERLTWDENAIKTFLKKLTKVIGLVKNHMLDINCIVLEPEYIFYKDEEYYFCYYPNLEKPLVESFHGWTEYLVKVVDYSNYDSVIWACGLHKESMEEQYNLEELLEGKLTVTASDMREKEPELRDRVAEETSPYPNRQEFYERERLQREGALWKGDERKDKQNTMNNNDQRLKEQTNKTRAGFKNIPMKRLWDRKKKEKWGEWGDLLSQEESSIMGKER